MRRIIGFALAFAGLLWAADLAACTTAIVRAGASASGRPMIWKQRDAEERNNYVKHFQGPRYAFTGIVDKGREDQVWDGANEAGFLIANNLSYNLRPDSLAGRKMRAGVLMKEALGRCRTVDEFEDYLKEMPEPRYVTANFAVADAEGGAAYFETWDYGYTRYDVPENGILYRTNYSVSGFSGKGKGYGRMDLMNYLTSLHGPTGYTPEWFLRIGRIVPIARPTTVSSVVLEGGAEPVLWAAVGYTPACYAVPVWVAAGAEIPAFLGEGSAANALAVALKKSEPFDFQSRIIPSVQKAERKEMRCGERLDERFRSRGFDADALRKYNREAERRFARFQKKMQP